MRIGLLPVDSKSNFPNLALMKLSRYHKERGDEVEFANPLFGDYDILYRSKVFTFTPDDMNIYHAHEERRGGTGYGIFENLPEEIDMLQPDYSFFGIDDVAYGFTTRGCCNRCEWCVVPRKEGQIHAYMNIEDIAAGNNTRNLILMDNNVLASEFGIRQIETAAKRGYRIDFNQGLDARRIDESLAKLLARVKWIRYIRLACDTSSQIPQVLKAMQLLRNADWKGEIFIYSLLRDFEESLNRLNVFHNMHDNRIVPFAQPYIDYSGKRDVPQWQKDMAHWCNRKWIFNTCEFAEFEPRKGFFCREYIEQNNLTKKEL